MILCEELYFEFTLTGIKSELKKFITFLKSGELDEFFEFSQDYITYDDGYDTADNDAKTSVVIANDDYGIEIGELDTEEFLDIFCRAAKSLDVVGHLYDIDDEEFCFTSAEGDSYYENSKNITKFNEDVDRETEDYED